MVLRKGCRRHPARRPVIRSADGDGRLPARAREAHAAVSAARRALAGAAVPLGYLALAIAASWPLARDFATHTVGDVHYDERHAIWVLWYTAHAFAGQVSWPDTTHLLYPHGISVLVDGVGPLNALLALPFWPWGAAAAFNGAALLGVAGSGWCCYALARGLGLARGPAFVAGALFLLWPMHLLALTGHLEKLFVGMLPLTMLAGLRAFDPDRGRAWLAAPGAALLGALLQNGNQFIFAALGVALVGVQAWLAAPAADSRRTPAPGVPPPRSRSRSYAPLLLAIVTVMRVPTCRSHSANRPALLAGCPEPRAAGAVSALGRLRSSPATCTSPTTSGRRPAGAGPGRGLVRHRPRDGGDHPADRDRAVRAGVARRAGRPWVVFGLVFAVLCLGPRLRTLGTMWPFGMLLRGAPAHPRARRDAHAGPLHDARQRRLRPRRRHRPVGPDARLPSSATAILVAAGVVIAAECWPCTFARPRCRVPEFYGQVAPVRGRRARSSICDGFTTAAIGIGLRLLPDRPPPPIAWSYLSRFHRRFPNDRLDPVEPRPAGRCDLGRASRRSASLVVSHQFPGMFVGGACPPACCRAPHGSPAPLDQHPIFRDASRRRVAGLRGSARRRLRGRVTTPESFGRPITAPAASAAPAAASRAAGSPATAGRPRRCVGQRHRPARRARGTRSRAWCGPG